MNNKLYNKKLNPAFRFFLNKKITIISLITIVMAAISLSSLGKPVNFIFPFNLSITNPCNVSEKINTNDYYNSEQISVVIDQQGRRLSILNSNKQVHSQVFFGQDDSKLLYAVASYRYDDDIYVYGYVGNEKNLDITGIRILRYSYDGDYIDTVYSYDFHGNDYRKVAELYREDGRLFVVSFEDKRVIIEEIIKENEVDNYSVREVYQTKLEMVLIDAVYVGDLKTIALIDYFGRAYYYMEGSFREFDLKNYLLSSKNISNRLKFEFPRGLNGDTIITVTDNENGNSFSLNLDFSFIDIDFDLGSIGYADSQNNVIYNIDYCNGKYEEYKSFDYESNLAIYTLIIWIARFYLILFILVIIGYWLSRLKKFSSTKFINFLIGFSVFLGIIFVSIFISSYFYDYSFKKLSNNLTCLSESVSSIHKYDNDTLTYSSFDREVVGEKKAKQNISIYDEFSKIIENYTISSLRNDMHLSYNLYGYDKDRSVVQYMHGSGIMNTLDYPKNFDNIDQFNKLMTGQIITDTSKGKYSSYLIAISPLYNYSNNIIGFIEFKSSLNYLQEELAIVFCSFFILIILLSIAIYLIITICFSINRNIKLYKKRLNEKLPHPEVYIAPIMDFFRNFIIYADTVLCVIITKAMLEQYGLSNNGLLLAIPLATGGLGPFAIGLIFSKIFKKINIKRAYFINILFMTVFLLLQAYSVYINDYILFCVFKLFSSFFNGAINVSDSSLPMCIDDESLRFKTFREITLTDISSPILSVMFAGFLAECFGSFSIYILCAVVSVIMLVIAMIFMPRNLYFQNHKYKNISKVKKDKIIKFFISPEIIGVVLVCFISVTISGYKSYLFPLYNVDLNISQTNISYYFAIIMALSFLVSKWIDSFEKQFEHWKGIIIYLSMTGIIFCLFMTNTTLIWALVTLLLTSIIQKIITAEWKVLWPRKCREMKIDPSALQPTFMSIEFSVITLRQFVLGMLLVFGSGGASVALGFMIFVIVFMFYLLTRKSSLRYP